VNADDCVDAPHDRSGEQISQKSSGRRTCAAVRSNGVRSWIAMRRHYSRHSGRIGRDEAARDQSLSMDNVGMNSRQYDLRATPPGTKPAQ
jgi:hypothetical protein